jgi:predicted PP-loop superfamily ATPase
MTYGNSINNTSVSSSSKRITFIKGKEPFMSEDKSNNIQKGKLKGKFIPICQYCEIEEHVKRNYFVSKNQNLEYKIDLVLNQLCTIERKIDK